MSDFDTDSARRRLIGAGLATMAALVSWPALALRPTPSQSRGPFYPVEIPLDHDTDLTQVEGQTERAEGSVVDVVGRVLDARGRPLAGARVEIWQCDARGRYRHPLDRGRRAPDPGFQGYGTATTGSDGAYRFRTIDPVPYPGRAPHIHFAIRDPQGHTLVTQMYVAGAAENPRDFLYSRLNEVEQKAVTVIFGAELALEGAERLGQFDIVLDSSGGTPALS